MTSLSFLGLSEWMKVESMGQFSYLPGRVWDEDGCVRKARLASSGLPLSVPYASPQGLRQCFSNTGVHWGTQGTCYTIRLASIPRVSHPIPPCRPQDVHLFLTSSQKPKRLFQEPLSKHGRCPAFPAARCQWQAQCVSFWCAARAGFMFTPWHFLYHH